MEDELDLSKFWCWQENCADRGRIGAGNIVLKERYGETPFFGLNTPADDVCRTLAMIPEKGSIRGAAQASSHSISTVCRWIDLAGKHCKEVNDYFLKDLRLDRVQIDEIWSYIKKGEKRRYQRFERVW